MPEGALHYELRGVAGQSLGAFLARGVRLTVVGEAQDFVGKGLAGGVIEVKPSGVSLGRGSDQVVAGNTVLYGATEGRCYISGSVGERFCVRNSGAEAVVEGCGDHACEYMTGGIAVVLGRIGRNIGAGMSGGVLWVYDAEGALESKLADGSVRLATADHEDHRQLRRLVRQHARHTESSWAEALLDSWSTSLQHFRMVVPRTNGASQVDGAKGPGTENEVLPRAV